MSAEGEVPHDARPTPRQPIEQRPGVPDIADLAARFPQLDRLELLGRGGMGVVYKARQASLDRWAALKLISPDIGGDADFTKRFAREARALARLSHPNIVNIYDFGEAGGVHYFLMEYVNGTNLRHMMRTGRCEPNQALAIIAQVCDALQYAHDEGINHRDIKPENILIDTRGRVKIADFGLAKLRSAQTGHYTVTDARQVMGTPQYMAPEQLERPGEVDHRADIYSTGVVLYELLTGELPIGRFSPPSHCAPLDARLDEIVLRSLEKEPQRRYQHASELRTSVQQIGSATIASTEDRPVVTPARMAIVLGLLIICFIVFAMIDISPVVRWMLILLLPLSFALSLWHRRSTIRTRVLVRASLLIAGLPAVFLLAGFVLYPYPVLDWVYARTGTAAGQHDAWLVRIVVVLAAALMSPLMIRWIRKANMPLKDLAPFRLVRGSSTPASSGGTIQSDSAAHPAAGAAGHVTRAGMATASLLCGLFGMVCVPFLGIVGLILGIIALIRAHRQPLVYGGKGLAIGGICTGIAGFYTIIVFAGIFLPAFAKASESSLRTRCGANLASVSLAMLAYAGQNNRALPNDLGELITLDLLVRTELQCPAVRGSSVPDQVDYLYISGQSMTGDPGDVLIYEPPESHNNKGSNVLFLDGQVKFIQPYSHVLDLVKQTRQHLAERKP